MSATIVDLSHTLSDIETLIQKHRASNPPPEQLLTTESPHPLTMKLSDLAQNNIEEGYKTLAQVDQQALNIILSFEENINRLSQALYEALNERCSIKMGGCGSAARAATVAEMLFGQAFPRYKHQVVADNAGGHLVIVKAAERFEDRPDYGREQISALGWQPGDVYIGVSASGAAGFVSGQLEWVLEQRPKRQPIFLICNPLEECLQRFAEDDKTVFHTSKEKLREQINFLSCPVGAMGVTGSTRMQAATLQLMVLSFSLLQAGQLLTGGVRLSLSDLLSALNSFLLNLPEQALADLTRFERQAYQEKNYIIYRAPPEIALTVATDTTERSPTFGLPTFENSLDHSSMILPSLCRIVVEGYQDTALALKAMLGCELRVLNWINRPGQKDEPQTTMSWLLGYDLTEGIIAARKAYLPHAQPREINISFNAQEIHIYFKDKLIKLPLFNQTLPAVLHSLYLQLALKMALNMHSTLVAGALELYSGNLMTFVKPSNIKLVNRAIALTTLIVKSSHFTNFEHLGLSPSLQKNITPEQIKEAVYAAMKVIKPGESVVFKARDAIIRSYQEAASPDNALSLFS